MLKRLQAIYTTFDKRIVRWLARHSIALLRIAVGLVYLWFGALKLFPGLSPAEPLIRGAMPSFLPMEVFIPFVGAWEALIGVLFITGKLPRVTIGLMLLQMGGAFSPLVLAPHLVWTHFPYAWTLEGQYIFKDIILVTAALVIAATVRGAQLREEARRTATQNLQAVVKRTTTTTAAV